MSDMGMVGTTGESLDFTCETLREACDVLLAL